MSGRYNTLWWGKGSIDHKKDSCFGWMVMTMTKEKNADKLGTGQGWLNFGWTNLQGLNMMPWIVGQYPSLNWYKKIMSIIIVMMMIMMAKLMTMIYIMTSFTSNDDQDDNCDNMPIIVNLTICQMLIWARVLIGMVIMIMMT